MKVPAASLWLVLPYHNKWDPNKGLDAWSRPAVHVPRGEEFSDLIHLPANTIITAGATVRGRDPRVGKSHVEYVETLMPIRCYINRTHFNEGSERLRRIA